MPDRTGERVRPGIWGGGGRWTPQVI